jgi:hypothetical protein
VGARSCESVEDEFGGTLGDAVRRTSQRARPPATSRLCTILPWASLAQNNDKATAAPRGRPFPAGTSGNPGGRPKGVVRRIREQTGDGAELVDYMLTVFRDECESTRTRVEAATWLADRGFGKPRQAESLGAEQGPTTIVVESVLEHRGGLKLSDLFRYARENG